MWAFSAQTHDNCGWPNDDETHPPNYWKGADAGVKYAKEHVMVKVIKGHVLTEYNATTHISDWFDGQNAHIQGRPLSKMYATNAYIAGYNATYRTMPPDIPLSQQVLAKKLADP
jgi:GH35 family endo-1,4-beta-xylanase